MLQLLPTARTTQMAEVAAGRLRSSSHKGYPIEPLLWKAIHMDGNPVIPPHIQPMGMVRVIPIESNDPTSSGI